jgi:ACS family hexuronate transporter-like MFS transporter
MPCAAFSVRAEAAWLLIALVSIATFGHQFWASSILTLPADLFRGRVVASCSGLTGTGATIGGIIASGLTGAIVTHPHGYTAVFTWAGLMHPLAVVLILLLIRPRTPR